MTDPTPWYRQFWPWFILSPLILVVIAGFWMIYIATVTSDGAVLDNYYEDGLSVIERDAQEDWAREHDLTARLQTLGRQVQLRLTGELAEPPAKLDLTYAFPTRASRDVTVRLARQPDGRYLGQLPEVLEGERELVLEPAGRERLWRLRGRLTLPDRAIQTLAPGDP